MKTIKKIIDLQTELNIYRNSGQKIGFVPTMGALHAGHVSLIDYSKNQNEITVASIFVNPTQFNNPEDLKHYPRTPETDAEKLQNAGCNILFMPEENEMYPEQDKRIFNFGALETVMEGKFRPGHFNGVAQIVSKLFDAVKPDRAYFGEKDFQQLAIIQEMVRKYMPDSNIEIIPCPIVREHDGLAMSSRNVRLNTEQRNAAPLIYQSIQKTIDYKKIHTVENTKNIITNLINSNSLLVTEYFEIVDAQNLQPVNNWNESTNLVACVAVQVGNIRLIDNIRL